MVAMVDSFEGGMELPFEMPGNTLAEDLRDFLGGQLKETEFAGAFEEFVDRKGFAEDKVETIFNLAEGIEAAEVHGLTFSFGELGTQEKRPVIKALLEQLRGQAVGSLLEGLRVINRQKGIVLFSERDAGSIQGGFYKVMAVDIIGGLKGEKGAHPHDHGSQDGITDIEVVMSKATAGLAKDGVIGIGGCKFRGDATEGGTLLHTLKDVVNAIAVLPLHLMEGWSNDLFFASLPFCPLDGDAMVGGIGFHPILVGSGPVHQDFFVDARNADDLTVKIDDVFWPGEYGQIPMDHDPIKAVVNEDQQRGIEFHKSFHRQSSLMI